MRLFLAIFPPKEHLDYFRDTLRHYNKQKRNLIPVPPEQTHLTLRFIGTKVFGESKDLIVTNLKKIESELTAPEIKIEEIRYGFKKQTFPRILMANIEETDSLVNLNNSVHEVIRNLKRKDTIYWREKYSNDFHITIARLKNSATKSTAKEIKSLTLGFKLIPPKSFIASEMYLMQSIPTNDGNIYKKLEKFTLKNS